MNTIIFATFIEAKPFIDKKRIQIKEEKESPFFMTLQHNGTQILLCITGMGKEKTQKSLKQLFESYQIDKVLNLGICGALSDNFKIGDIFSITQVSESNSESNNVFYPKKIRGIKSAILATSEKPVFDDQLKQKLSLKADLVDMEGLYIAQYCHQKNITYSLIKIVSDNAGDSAKKNLEKNLETVSKKLLDFLFMNKNLDIFKKS